MRRKIWRRAFFLLLGSCFVFPFTSLGVGHLIIYAIDTRTYDPPPLTAISLDGNAPVPLGTNAYVFFENVAAGPHTVEVTTASSGYLPRESPDTPNAVNDPTSDYGNPRYIEVPDNQAIQHTFRFDPMITVSATIRDAWTMERIDSAAIEFTVNSGSNVGLDYTEFPWEASYACCWKTVPSGAFPTNVFLYLDDYDLKITRSGYETLHVSDVIANAESGDTFNLGELFLTPVDMNTNQIGDLWETLYFGAGNNTACEADADGDGACNRDEYVAGTDPTNQWDYLCAGGSPLGNGTFELGWDTQPDRTYRITGTTHLGTGTWVQVAGPWEASSNQYVMTWVETNTDLSWCSSYRVEVVPCTWTGTNQVLINTNRPAGGGGGGSGTWTNGPPIIPPVP